MAVLLIDTQGTFDHQKDTHLEACLFGLSATLSSCQIFNIRNQMQADTLGSLAVYLEYGTAGRKNRSGGGQDDRAPFQRLEVLIRDWPNFACPDEPVQAPCEELLDQFLEYMDGILGKATTNSAKVKECFRDRIGCFGLPHPGQEVATSSFDGNICKIDEGFRRLVTYYVEEVIFGKLKKTNVPNLPNRGEGDFVRNLKEWVQLFSKGLTNGELPSAGSWLDKMHETYNHTHMDEILEGFKTEMDQRTKGYVDPAELQWLLQAQKKDAMSRFEPRGDATTAKRALERKLDKEAKRMTEENDSRKQCFNQFMGMMNGLYMELLPLFSALHTTLLPSCSTLQAAFSVVTANLRVGCLCGWGWIRKGGQILRQLITVLKFLGLMVIVIITAVGVQVILQPVTALKWLGWSLEVNKCQQTDPAATTAYDSVQM
ncbi:unnamed protein product [Ectocarpus fasciculatus]